MLDDVSPDHWFVDFFIASKDSKLVSSQDLMFDACRHFDFCWTLRLLIRTRAFYFLCQFDKKARKCTGWTKNTVRISLLWHPVRNDFFFFPFQVCESWNPQIHGQSIHSTVSITTVVQNVTWRVIPNRLLSTMLFKGIRIELQLYTPSKIKLSKA